MTDPRVRALALVRQAAPTPAPPNPRLPDALPPAVIDGAASTWLEARRDWTGARGALRRGSRSGNLNSRRRRARGDLVAALIRHERSLEAMLSVLGVAPTPGHLARAAAVLHLGLPADRVSAFDAAELADPVHLLTGWALANNPTPTQALATAASVSDAIAGELLDAPDAPALLAALDRRAPLCLRALGDRDALIAELQAAGLGAEPSPVAPDAVRLHGHPDVAGLPAVKAGRAIVQDEGSQLVAALVDAQPGETVVDACAGAGGKTLALAASMQGKGRLVACDVRNEALGTARSRVRQAGFDHVRTVTLQGDRLPKEVPKADRVLVDAPCSGTGALRRQPWNRWLVTGPRLDELTALQASILRRFADRVRPGGVLVYATCSVLPRENRGIVDAFLADRPDFTLGPPAGERLAPTGVLSLRPDRDGCDGFFAAVLHKAPGGSA